MEIEIGDKVLNVVDTNARFAHEFGKVAFTLKKDKEEYTLHFGVVQPSDGTMCSDLWYAKIDNWDVGDETTEETKKNLQFFNIAFAEDNTIEDEAFADFILEVYCNKYKKEYDGSEIDERFADYEIEVDDVSPICVVESGYVEVQVDELEDSIYFDIIQSSEGYWHIAIEDDHKESLKSIGIEIETEEIDVRGYGYDCIIGDDYNDLFDSYDRLTADKR